MMIIQFESDLTLCDATYNALLLVYKSKYRIDVESS